MQIIGGQKVIGHSTYDSHSAFSDKVYNSTDTEAMPKITAPLDSY